MSKPITGIIHVHSEFSSDGFHSVADLADFARQSGFRFVGLTDHSEDLSAEDIQSLQRECIKCSDELLIMIPGLEFRCQEDVHILGIGVTENITSVDPVTVASEIQERGGLALLAHPGRNEYQFPRELCRVLDGIEIWNAGYDGRFVPPLANLRLLEEARAINPAVLGFGGADLHGFDQPPGVALQLQENGSGQVDIGMVLHGLRSGSFSVRGTYLTFDATTGSHRVGGIPLITFRKLYEISRAVRNVVLGGS